MPQRYETYGPFLLDGESADYLGRPSSIFWEKVESQYPGLSMAIGVYIVAARNKNGSLPWYVGMTEKGFKSRLNQHRKTFPLITAKCEEGTQEIYLIARQKLKRDAFMKAGGTRRPGISHLETRLIETCLKRNRDLHNDRNTRGLKDTVVPGYMNDKGKRSRSAASLNALITGNAT